jgi:DNA-binding MarR family transcriptional regulator/GNAT superfamily N-acetyltransferase
MSEVRSAEIAQVRSFNRLVTHRVGALHDHYLSRDRSLGEARVLWEVGERGSDVRALRARLDLDSGYLSRLLRSLESAGLVEVRPSAEDGRVRQVVLTPEGSEERTVLDRSSDVLAASMLEPLSATQRERLVAAMAEVERLLTATLVEVRVTDPAHEDAQHCVGQYFEELARRFPSGFDPAVSRRAAPEEMRPPRGLFLVATLHGEPVGCGGLKFHPGEPTEIKRMWVAESARGLGVGRRLLTRLEELAAEQGADAVRLDTNGNLREAIAMYRTNGYREVEPFNDEPYADHWFEKQLDC